MNTTVKRTIVGIMFLAIMVGSLLFGPGLWIPVFIAILLESMREFFTITTGAKKRPAQMAAMLVAGAVFVLSLAVAKDALSPAWMSLSLVFLLLLMLVMVFDHTDFKEYAYLFTALLYIGLPIALSPFMVYSGGAFDGRLMLSFFILIWTSDTGAYCFGLLFGQKIWPAKLCPSISPKKSWAGAVGGMVASLLSAYILLLVGWLPYPLMHVLILAALMNVLGVFGDLFESLWKRQAGVKDSGNILPGHGGLLDRFDSSLFAMPAGYVYLLLNGLI